MPNSDIAEQIVQVLWPGSWDATPTADERAQVAEILLIVADEFVPEVPPPSDKFNDRAWGMWEKQLVTRWLLLDAADEAGAGQ